MVIFSVDWSIVIKHPLDEWIKMRSGVMVVFIHLTALYNSILVPSSGNALLDKATVTLIASLEACSCSADGT